MTRTRVLAMFIAWAAVSTSSVSAQDLSRYREFQLGMSLVTVAEQAGINSEARVLHRRPALIEELMWQPPRGSSRQGDSVKKVLFTFYNGQLVRVLVNYDRARTEGLTPDDMVEALSATYGLATLPAAETFASSSRIPEDRDRIVGHWQDSLYSVDLSSSSLSTFGLVVSSTRLDALARSAAADALRLDEQEAPQREIERQVKRTEDSRMRLETVRRANKAIFRP